MDRQNDGQKSSGNSRVEPNLLDDVSVNTLLKQARGGNASSQNELFGQLQTYLKFVADRHLSPDLKAKLGTSDLVQLSFLQAVEGFAGFRGSSAEEFRGWLRQIVVNEARQIAKEEGNN